MLKAVGAIRGRMPWPGDLRAGPMHGVPSLQLKTWVRLASRPWYTTKNAQDEAGSRPILSLTAFRSRCLQPKYRSVV